MIDTCHFKCDDDDNRHPLPAVEVATLVTVCVHASHMPRGSVQPWIELSSLRIGDLVDVSVCRSCFSCALCDCQLLVCLSSGEVAVVAAE